MFIFAYYIPFAFETLLAVSLDNSINGLQVISNMEEVTVGVPPGVMFS